MRPFWWKMVVGDKTGKKKRGKIFGEPEE